MINQDQIIKCEDCAQDFAWTADEQVYYAQKDLKPPKKCPICRAVFKASQQDRFRGKRSAM